MKLLLVEGEKRAVANLNSDAPADIPDFEHGETRLVEVALVRRITGATTARLFEPLSVTGYDFKAAIGQGFLQPRAGVYTITFGANTTAAIDYDATAAEIETAINLLASVIAAGGVTVESTVDGYYLITFDDVGARDAMSGDAANLTPQSVLDFGTLIQGSATLREVQTLRIVQSAVNVELADDSDAASATVTVVATGGGGLNAKVRVTFDPLPYDGKWSVTIAALESALMDWNVEEADVVLALEGIEQESGLLVTGRKYKIVEFETGDVFTNVGAASNATGVVFVASGTTPTTWTNLSRLSPVATGNVTVSKEAEGQYLIAFQNDMANTAMGTITADAGALQVIPYKIGNLDLREPAIELMLGASESIDATFAVEGTPSGGTVQKFLRQDVKVWDSIIDPSSGETQGGSYRIAVPITLVFQGTLTDETLFGYYVAPVNLRIYGADLSAQTAPTGAAVTIDLTVGGAEQTKIATLADGATVQATTYGAPLDVASGSIVRAKIKSIGSGAAGANLQMILLAKQ